MTTSLYQQIGGEATLKALVDKFYDLMEQLPEAKLIRDMHAADLQEAREKLYMFMVGWSGGPQLYQERFGHPRLRMRHMPFSIGAEERDQWMLCMRTAVQSCISDPNIREKLIAQFYNIADFMRNREE